MTDQPPTERELEALKVLWLKSEATVREVCDAMNSAGEELAYTTVLSLLQVMEQKGLVGHRKDGKAYVYLPQVNREETLGGLASGFLERVFDGAINEYLVHVLGDRDITQRELDELEKMIAEAREGDRTNSKKRGKS